jgi:hypothetical protein
MQKSSTAKGWNVEAAPRRTMLVPANAARLGAIIWNDAPTVLYLKYGAPESAADYREEVQPESGWHMPMPAYKGDISGIWSADVAGAARVTELLP